MKLKPRSTVLHPRAAVYKRYTQIEKVISKRVIYKTLQDDYLWYFDNSIENFVRLQDADATTFDTVVNVANDGGISRYQYLNKVFYYTHSSGWQYSETLANFSGIKSTNIGKYQVNSYCYNGSFDYVIKGSITSSTAQYIKGNIVPYKSLNIKYFNDNVNLQVDDLVVIQNNLYAVESVEEDHKHQPKDFKIYFATLNSIL